MKKHTCPTPCVRLPPPLPWLFMFLLLTWLPRLVAEDPSPQEPAPAKPEETIPCIQHLGQSFNLAQHREDKVIETDTFVLAGEKLSDWSQILTVQRLLRDSSIEGLVDFLRKRLSQDSQAEFSVQQQSSCASIFTASIPAVGEMPAQQLVGLIISEQENPARLNVIQFAVKPSRVEANCAELQLLSWKSRFKKQAEQRNKALLQGGS